MPLSLSHRGLHSTKDSFYQEKCESHLTPPDAFRLPRGNCLTAVILGGSTRPHGGF